MNFINKLERKFGKFKIDNLINYIIVLYGLGYVLNQINPLFYYQFFSLDIEKVLQGQIWRLVTFIIESPSGDNPLFLALALYFYYMIGHALENAWGAFRFNLYFLTGILFNILAAFIYYFIVGYPYTIGLTYINQAMFFAFAAIYPNVELLLMYILPIKVKYLAYLNGAFLAYEVFVSFQISFYNGMLTTLAIIVSLANFFIFFLSSRNYRRISPKEYKRKANFKKQVRNSATGTRHKCTVCGRTELDDENLEFRFCSRCDGNYEYCMEHLFTHEHIHHNKD